MSHRNENGFTPEQQWELDSHRMARADFRADAKSFAEKGHAELSHTMSRRAAQCTVAIVAMEKGFKIGTKIFGKN